MKKEKEEELVREGKKKEKEKKKEITGSRKTIDSSLIYQRLLGNIHYQSLVQSSP